jgi:predicted Fe-Mo cluster-binding NifX family protein
MKIAVASDDGKTISQHFGRAPYYVVVTVEHDNIAGREQRAKAAHVHGHGAAEHEHDEQPHAADAHHHMAMADAIRDCEAVLCRGMGWPAYDSMVAEGIKPVVTDVTDIDAAALAYANGTLIDHKERLH